MKPSEQRKIIGTDQDIQDYYYDLWFCYWYDGGEFDDDPDFFDIWLNYKNDITRLRQEKLDKIFDINQPPTIKDIWPK